MAGKTDEILVVSQRILREDQALFQDDGLAFKDWLPLAVDDPARYPATADPKSVFMLLGQLMQSSAEGLPDWQRWKLFSQDQDLANYFSRDYEIPTARDNTKFRLNFLHPLPGHPKAMVNLEIPVDDELYNHDKTIQVITVGMRAIWTPGEASDGQLYLKNASEVGELLPFPPTSDHKPYWDKFIKAVVSAHAEFCPEV